jgi:hypothetical protein
VKEVIVVEEEQLGARAMNRMFEQFFARAATILDARKTLPRGERILMFENLRRDASAFTNALPPPTRERCVGDIVALENRLVGIATSLNLGSEVIDKISL